MSNSMCLVGLYLLVLEMEERFNSLLRSCIGFLILTSHLCDAVAQVVASFSRSKGDDQTAPATRVLVRLFQWAFLLFFLFSSCSFGRPSVLLFFYSP